MEGLTVAQAIDLLKAMSPQAVLAIETEFGACAITKIRAGYIYRCQLKPGSPNTGFDTQFEKPPAKYKQWPAAILD